MTVTTPVLDEAYEAMAASDFELPNGFVFHGPMACEALAVLDLDDAIDPWARRFARLVGHGPRARPPSFAPTGWDEALGEYDRLPEWLSFFDRAVADEGWEAVVGTWVPRLAPALATALYHGAIRTAHAVRALSARDSDPRRAELVRALAYWAARYRPGRPTDAVAVTDEDVRAAITAAAADGARHYVAAPSIFALHGVTGAMALALLVDHVEPDASASALAQLRADHAAMYADTPSAPDPSAPDDGESADAPSDGSGAVWDDTLAGRAAQSGDVHEVKLVEACRRGFRAAGDQAFLVAARRAVAP